ncbi:MAG TPA: hypothetical protein VMX12_03420, partial [Acidimicrobiia bacterium]|nr:hypothetical protein [Acidimicrobiia bacterium]
MPQLEIQSPGVYGFEKEPSRAPEGISPAKAGFVGWTDEGPSHTPVEVRSVVEFVGVFGNITALGLVPIGMHGFFGNGGERAYIVRVTPADSVSAKADIDLAPIKWTFTMKGEGIWGNVTIVRVRGNRNFLDRTPGSEKFDKSDVLVLRPSDFDAAILQAEESYEAVQFVDPSAGDYILNVLTDPRRPSVLVDLTEVAGGVPSAFDTTQQTDVVLVASGLVNGILTNFVATLGEAVLDGTLRIVAAESTVDDEAQTPGVAPNDVLTDFGFTLPSIPILDGSLSVYGAAQPVSNENVVVGGLINSANTVFTVAASALSDKVHRENTVFRLKYAASASGPNVLAAGVPAATHDLSTTPITVGIVPAIHPGTVSISLDIGAGPVLQLDNGAGVFTPTAELPAGGTINYDTGALTGVTAVLLAASSVLESHNTGSIITKAVVAANDNLELGTLLAGAVSAGTIDHVDSITTPTGNGALAFTTSVAPLFGTTFFLDFVPLQIVDYDLAGVGTGDVGGGTLTADHVTGVVA